MQTISKEIRLASRPSGTPTLENFQLAETTLPALVDGEVRVRNLWMSVDPYMRGRMRDYESYLPPFQIGQALEGAAVGEVVASHAAEFEPGDLVLSMLGWRDILRCRTTGSAQADSSNRIAGNVFGGLRQCRSHRAHRSDGSHTPKAG
jgi:NADPH-dependent curcumin reductase CurA